MTPDQHAKRQRRMAAIDRLPRDIRDLVNEEGWTIIDAFLQCGVTKANRIRHLITTVRDGSGVYGNSAYNDSFVIKGGARVHKSEVGKA